jgi:LAO/AO transport system kinase
VTFCQKVARKASRACFNYLIVICSRSVSVVQEMMELVTSIEAGSRRSLAKCLSLCESHLASRSLGEASARLLLRRSCNKGGVARVGITGPPGAGKSSLIETLGLELLKRGTPRLGVLCVDPSSALTGGSILGDRTRMTKLSTLGSI